MGFFGTKKFAPKKSTMRRAQSLNSLKDPIQMQREFNPDPNNVKKLEFLDLIKIYFQTSFKVGETTVKVKPDGSLTTLYNEGDFSVKEVSFKKYKIHIKPAKDEREAKVRVRYSYILNF